MKTKNSLNYFSNFYFFTSLIFIIFYLLNRFYYSHWDSLYLYIVSLKPLINQKIYVDYSFSHSPYLNFFYELLNLLNINSFNFLLILGIIQCLFAGYLSVLFCKQIVKSELLKKICFIVTIFFIGNEYFYFYWDCYALLIGIYALNLIFFEKKNILGTLLLSFVWFLKQTFGVTFFLIFVFLSIANYFFYKKKYYYINFVIFFLFTLVHLFIIYLFSDLNAFYRENFLVIFNYASTYERNSLVNYLFGIIFLLPDVYSLAQLKFHFLESRSLSQLTFYTLFRFPIFIINIYLLFNFKHFFKKHYQAFLIIILSCILPLPLLGRGYWGTIYFFPQIILIFFMYLNKNKIFLPKLILKKKLFFIYTYLIIIFIYLLLQLLHRINYNLNWNQNVIHSQKNFFLNINRTDIDKVLNKSNFEDTKDMYFYLNKHNIKNIFVLDTHSLAVMVLLPQVPVNRDYMGISPNDELFDWGKKFWNDQETNLERFVNDFFIKSPEYVLYNRFGYSKFIKVLPKNLLVNYSLFYSNSNFVLLKKN